MIYVWNFNETLTNDVINFEQLAPVLSCLPYRLCLKAFHSVLHRYHSMYNELLGRIRRDMNALMRTKVKWAATRENQQCGFWPGLTQSRLYSHWRWLEAWKFEFREWRYCTIQVAKTKALISFAVTAKADLRLCFRICRLLVFSWRGSNISTKYEPCCEKTCLLGVRPGLTQTRLYSHRRWLCSRNKGMDQQLEVMALCFCLGIC